MLSLLNFRNYELDYAIEYPEAISQYKMTTRTRLSSDFEGWFFHNDFQSIYILYSALLISDFWYLFFKPTWFQRSTSNFRWIREDICAK